MDKIIIPAQQKDFDKKLTPLGLCAQSKAEDIAGCKVSKSLKPIITLDNFAIIYSIVEARKLKHKTAKKESMISNLLTSSQVKQKYNICDIGSYYKKGLIKKDSSWGYQGKKKKYPLFSDDTVKEFINSYCPIRNVGDYYTLKELVEHSGYTNVSRLIDIGLINSVGKGIVRGGVHKLFSKTTLYLVKKIIQIAKKRNMYRGDRIYINTKDIGVIKKDLQNKSDV